MKRGKERGLKRGKEFFCDFNGSKTFPFKFAIERREHIFAMLSTQHRKRSGYKRVSEKKVREREERERKKEVEIPSKPTIQTDGIQNLRGSLSRATISNSVLVSGQNIC